MPTPPELPIAGARRERGDAAANREKILAAARRLLAERGVEALTMDAVAAAAGVGKGTVFRRFGDRAGLVGELVDTGMRDFQEAFLSGPPPLGPGAPAPERLEAFVVALVHLQLEELEPVLAAAARPGEPLPAAFGVMLVHVATLVREIDAALPADVLAGMVLEAVSPSVVFRAKEHLGADAATLEAAALGLVRGLTRP